MKQIQQSRLLITPSLRISLRILEMPQQDLSEWIQEEIEKNPLLEGKSKRRSFSEPGSIPAKPSLREVLIRQAREQFEGQDLAIALRLIDQIDERGFFVESVDPNEEKILKILQAFEPKGIFAGSLQEYLMSQLPEGLTKNLVRDHFQLLLKGRFSEIQRKMKISREKSREIFSELSHLSMRPSSGFDEAVAFPKVPDLVIKMKDQEWALEIGEEEIPLLRIRSDLLLLVARENFEDKKIVKGWFQNARQIQKAIHQRREMLQKIGESLIRTQGPYFSQEGEIFPLSIQELACQFGVHPTTIWRAVTGKIVACPRGMISLKTFFSPKRSIRELLKKMIQEENRCAPLTDEQIAQKLQAQGFRCARRTIAHYRNSLKLRASKRRVF